MTPFGRGMCVLVISVLSLCTAVAAAQGEPPRSFSNPFVLARNGFAAADPSIVFKDGFYFWARSLGPRGIGIARASRLQELGRAPMVIVQRPADMGAYAHDIWAPELKYIQGRWYLYYAASDGKRANLRMFALAADTQDPQGSWTLHGKLASADDHWAIDGTVLEKSDGSLYFIWSGWAGAHNEHQQNLYIAPMRDPLHISGERVLIASPTHEWEKSRLGAHKVGINEAPETIQRNNTISLVYSAAGSWSGQYKLGLLTNTDGNVLQPTSWVKRQLPVFQANPAGQVYGVGHHTFTQSPDGTEDWIVYHGMQTPDAGWKGRSLRAQPFTWQADDTPDFGVPDADGALRPEPSRSSP